MTTGYSGTPLAKKLGIKTGMKVFAAGAPNNYRKLLEPIPEGVDWASRPSESADLFHLFCVERSELEKALPIFRAKMNPAAVVWVSWPKKASKVPTDITEDTIRETAFPLGLVDIKVCAVDEVWSGLKLVVRKELR